MRLGQLVAGSAGGDWIFLTVADAVEACLGKV
jgi:hypothetical protein